MIHFLIDLLTWAVLMIPHKKCLNFQMVDFYNILVHKNMHEKGN